MKRKQPVVVFREGAKWHDGKEVKLERR